MQLYLYLEINTIALAIIGLIYSNIRHKFNHQLIDLRLFYCLLFFTAIILVADTLMWSFDGSPTQLCRIILISSTVIYYILQPTICMIWTLYVDYSINHSKNRLKKSALIVSLPVMINAVITLLSLTYKLYFYFDNNNGYHRGEYFIFTSIFSFIYAIYTFIYVVINRKRIYKKFYYSFLMYAVPPLIGAIIQTAVYGLALIWIGMTLSILIVFINYQNEQMYMDYLTGLFNRRQLDFYLQDQINKRNRNLAGIMLDLNSFKMINDRYGHNIGDEALRNTSEILKQTFGNNAFLARFGGDEFVILIDAHNQEALDSMLDTLNTHREKFNATNKNSYQIMFSIGVARFAEHDHMDGQDFLNHIDSLMYANKKMII